jgi:phosphoribosylanthranilate isomerase
VDAGASAIGIVFWPGSPRCVVLARAEAIARAAEGATRVGVFADQAPAFVREVVEQVPLDAVQLHGREAVGDYPLGVPLVKAFGVRAGWHIGALEGLPERVLVLLDAHDDRRKGGTGARIDWQIAAAAAATRPVALAGGLNSGNVAEAIRTVRPYALDVSSGVERSPGVKDTRMIEELIETVRRVAGDIPRGLL